MKCYMYIRSCLWTIGFFSLAGSVPWIDPSLEALDEINDAEIYRAVVTSMNEWQKKRDLKRSTNRTKREDTNVCYTELGCFDASGPFGYLDMLPSKPEEINTKFLLYPAKNRRRRSGSAHAEVPFEKINDAFEWAKSGFNASLPTKVLIHGFGSDCSYIWAYEIRSALMAVEEVNTICVDWTKGAELPNYVKASANTRLVGKQLSLLLRGLADKNGLKLETTHLIGFSLGAHIAGFAGADLGNLSRITGLDPAGPLFESQDPRARLDQNDAHFVDVIHSNGENLILGGLGSSQPMGHVDFYPNGGRMQKGCSHLFVGAVSDIIWSSAVEGRSLCNHRRAYKFFIDSVSPRCHFPAFPCDSHDDFLEGKCFPCTQERKCGNMGYYADKSKGRGQLYLITRDEEPFCAHQYLVKLETDPGPIPIKSYGKVQITLIGDSFLNETFMMTKKEDEELNLGQPISRIIVPHPILSQPIKIQILYTAYSGWLSSGLSQWKIDKISLMNSFGETSSICKKNLILESGVPLSIPLYPGECEPPKDKPKINLQDRADLMPNFTVKEPFTPTQVIRDGINDKDISSKETNEIPLKNEKENNVDSDAESSRAFNTRIIKADLTNKHLADSDGLIREVVEPILKPHSHIVKNSRSHNHKKEKPEISEPILGPTTSKTAAVQKVADEEKDEIIKYESTNWQVPPVVPEKWNREDESKSLRGFETTTRRNDPIEAIVTTVQFLPQRLARMFEQAEKYARDTLLPFVSTYTPRFLNDIIRPRDPPKYVPLHFEENVLKRQEKKTNFDKSEINFNKKEESENELRVSETRNFKQQDFAPPSKEPLIDEFVETTSYSHIQRITKKPSPEKVEYVFAERLINPEPTSTTQKPSSPSTTTEQKPISSTKVVEATTQSTTFTSSSTVTSVSETLSTSTQKQENPIIGKQKSYNIFVDWGTNKTLDNNQETNKRHNTSIELVPKTISDNIRSNNDEFRPIEAIVNAFNVLPSGLASLFNRAEKYARKNIWPLVDSYVDEFLKDRQQTPSTTPYPTLTENIMLIRDPILFEETSTKTTSFKNAIEEESSVIMKVKPKTTDSSLTDIRYKAVTHFPVNVNRLSISKEKTSEMTSSEQITPKIVVTTKSNQNNDFQNNRATEFSNNRNITWLTLKIPKSDVKSKSRNITFNTAINTSYTSSNSLDNFSTIFYEKTANSFKHHDLPSKTSIEIFTEASLAVTNPITIDSSTLEVELLSPKIDRVFVEDTTDILSTSTDTEGKLSTITKAKFTNIDSVLNISKMNNTNTSASPSITELSSTTLITNMIKSNSNNTESGVVQSDLEYFLDTNNSTVNSFLPSFSGTVRNTKGINVEQSINPKTKISATPNENIHNLTVIYSLYTETQSTKSNNINDSVHSTTKILIQPDIEVAKHNLSNKTMKYNYNITNYSAASTIENFNHSTTEVYGTTAELVIITNSSIKGQYNTNNLTALKNISVDNIQNSTPYIESAKMQRISELMVSATSKKAGGSEEISSTTTGTNTISASELPLSTTRATRPSSTTTMIPPLKVTKSFIKKSYVHVQRIPKKGEKVQYKMPKWSDIRIDPALLESTTLQTLSISTTTKITTSTVKRPFVSYIQKIPKKGKKIYYDIPKFILVDGEVDKNVLRKRQIT